MTNTWISLPLEKLDSRDKYVKDEDSLAIWLQAVKYQELAIDPPTARIRKHFSLEAKNSRSSK